ncbi:MAG: hypothetical protein JNM78_11880 [Cyclobacteriaceae bacterium]|nr:hypothetical protein [Cyclobacteriaceae bacterium]
MKAKSILLMVSALVAFNFLSYGQVTHTIILHVDTGVIQNSNVDQVCNFGQDASISNRNYSIVVEVGDIVKWIGVSSSSPNTDQVEITSINHEGGARVFGKNVLNGTKGVVVGTVTDGKKGNEEKYKISFKVKNNGTNRNGTFSIDPKIIIKP